MPRPRRASHAQVRTRARRHAPCCCVAAPAGCRRACWSHAPRSTLLPLDATLPLRPLPLVNRWVDDCHAAVVCSDPAAARQLLAAAAKAGAAEFQLRAMRMRAAARASCRPRVRLHLLPGSAAPSASRTACRRGRCLPQPACSATRPPGPRPTELLPPKPRPKTSAAVARRLIGGALNLKLRCACMHAGHTACACGLRAQHVRRLRCRFVDAPAAACPVPLTAPSAPCRGPQRQGCRAGAGGGAAHAADGARGAAEGPGCGLGCLTGRLHKPSVGSTRAGTCVWATAACTLLHPSAAMSHVGG